MSNQKSSKINEIECDVVILGGSLSSFSSAIHSAKMKVKTCLIEPTDWIGGQLTSSGVSAIDLAWHVLKSEGKIYEVFENARLKENLPNLFNEMISKVKDTGKCWVSIDCFSPNTMLTSFINPLLEEHKEYLFVYKNAVIKRINENDNEIKNIIVIQRIVKESTKCKGYDFMISQDIDKYYSEEDDYRYTKKIFKFFGKVFIESSEWGELLSLLHENKSYLQGTSEQFDGDISTQGNENCGQSIVYGFAQEINKDYIKEPSNPYPIHHGDFYSLQKYTWDSIWKYRRLFINQNHLNLTQHYIYKNDVYIGDISLQNWGSGNDYSFGYLYKNFDDTKEERKDWKGGIHKSVLQEAEYLAYGWHYFFKNKNLLLRNKIYMNKSFFGTCHGLVKTPYIRDTKRSIGIDNFVLKISDISGDFMKELTGKKFDDRIAIGCYDVDIHVISNCNYSSYIKTYYPILPFYIPFKSLTNRNYKNLIVSGKNIAQSFLTSSATRVHPIEFAIGVASGIISGWMIRNEIFDTKEVFKKIDIVQEEISKYTPIEWSIKYPPK